MLTNLELRSKNECNCLVYLHPIIMKSISLTDYNYNLPENRIAKFPLENRANSKLMIYKNGITHSHFHDISKFLPPDSHLVFNNTKVIPARIHMKKDTGGEIEIFLIEPIEPSRDFQISSNSFSPVTWKCIIGNKRRWKDGQLVRYSDRNTSIIATWVNREENIVKFEWESKSSFVELLESIGKMPIPPYLKREATELDKYRYQTIYGKIQGAVAAPTAGLHYTEEILEQLAQIHTMVDVTLHVSSGTFKPISSENVLDHDMHVEFIQLTKESIRELAEAKSLILTGTTTLRTLESLYWFGVKLSTGDEEFFIEKLYPYSHNIKDLPSRSESLNYILSFLDKTGEDELTGSTEIFIFPGYKFHMVEGLITNFHMPGSTLILLIAAYIGDSWRDIYKNALSNDYRFLSYGDSSLLINTDTV